MKRPLILLLCLLFPHSAIAFCGFYVAKADASLYNKASQVVLVRHENKTALTMYSDFKGDMKDFALVIPVPEVLTREQIHVGDRAMVERIDAFTAPRLVEYFDDDPCAPQLKYEVMRAATAPMGGGAASGAAGLGVKIEAQYTIGEYDIIILSAKDSKGLETWLNQSGYKVPAQAHKALEPYIKQNLKFFVAKVNLTEQAKSGFTYLRPLQFAYESPRYMLPIRLGMANSEGEQDMLVYAITRKGRVETTNYRTVKLPSELDVPLYVKSKFADFYKALFDVAHEKEGSKAVFLEYAWNMSWCDPCAAEPLKPEELRKLGVFWMEEANTPGGIKPLRGRIMPPPGNAPVEAFVTRLHLRYAQSTFPEDLMFQETADTENFQGRYILRHPWTGSMKCDAAKQYKESLKERRKGEAQNLARLTQWDIGEIYKQMDLPANEKPQKEKPKKWFQTIFR